MSLLGTAELLPHPAHGLLSSKPEEVVDASRVMWMATLDDHGRSVASDLLRIAYSSAPETERNAAYQAYLAAHPKISDRMNAMVLMHKWADIVRAGHERAHRNGVDLRLGNENGKMAPGQTVRGATQPQWFYCVTGAKSPPRASFAN